VTSRAASLREARPRAAYLHVPFCAHRCGYCNFALVAGRRDLMPQYLEAIALELERHLTVPAEVDTLYFGGGTPTQLGVKGLGGLFDLARYWHPVAEGYEWTVEANPADVDQGTVDLLAQSGVNRLSLGGQSFNPAKLAVLERDHSPADIERSLLLAHQAGMQVGLDLIFAAPGETLAIWERDLEQALSLAPDHISVYGLTYEKGTSYWTRRRRGELASLDEDLERQMYELAIDRLAAAGFEHYEVSNFAQPGKRSRHNETYWRGEEYFATGPGAARYVGGVRETNHRSTTTWLKRVLAGESPVAEREELDAESRARERLVFALRRLEGISRQAFERDTGYSVDMLAGEAIARFVAYGLLNDTGQQIALTREGLMVSDAMWPELV
jgi:oxygen-independent coproporphyrinogen-3 oxidase